MAAGLPIDLRALYDAGRRLNEDREKPVRIAVLVEIDAPDALVEAARDAFHPRTANAVVDVAVMEPDSMVRVDSRADAAVVLVGSATHVVPTLADLRARALPTAVVGLGRDREVLSRLLGHPANDTVTGADPDEVMAGPLADWALERMPKLHSALAHNFAFVRRAVAKEAVQRTAWQNAAIGALLFLPGADMPVMTLNQGKMLLQVAAAYGQPLDRQRVKELAAVVAGGFVFRTFAREAVGIVPGVGWAIKGGIAYSGTVAMGMAAIGYFEEGADLSVVLRSMRERAGETAARVGSRVRSLSARHEPAELPAPAHETGYTQAVPAPQQPALLEVEAPAPSMTVKDDDAPGGAEGGRA